MIGDHEDKDEDNNDVPAADNDNTYNNCEHDYNDNTMIKMMVTMIQD